MPQGAARSRRFIADYIRGATGARYRYEAGFSLGDTIRWQAEISRDDIVHGRLGGTLRRNGMDEASIVGVIKAQVEEGIERLDGVLE